MKGHDIFRSTGEVVVAADELRFRTFEDLVDILTEAGFTIDQVYGDWKKGPLLETSRAMIFVARRD